MATIEERLALLESEHAELKKTMELQTIAIGALVNKAALERLNEKYDKLFDTLISHDRFVNEQLAELRGQQIELDGKVVGLQTEMRQRFDSVEQRFATVDTRLTGLEQRFGGVDTRLTGLEQRFDGVDTRLVSQDNKLDDILSLLKNRRDKN